MSSSLTAFLPELVLLAGALGLFGLTLGSSARQSKIASLVTAVAFVAAVILSFGTHATLFNGAYRVDAFSQLFKLILGLGYIVVLLLGRSLDDIRQDIRSEYYLFLSLGICGLAFLFSSVEIISIVVSLELSSYPLYLMVAMRRERDGQRVQMESAIKYMMFGISANGIMFFGLSYLFGLTGTTSLIACSYSATPTSVQAGVLPPITLGIVAVLKWALPGSSRSGEYTRKKLSPITRPRLSTSGRSSPYIPAPSAP